MGSHFRAQKSRDIRQMNKSCGMSRSTLEGEGGNGWIILKTAVTKDKNGVDAAKREGF